MRFSNLIRKIFVGAALALVPAASFAGVFVSVTIAPPVLPVYTQPVCPGDGYLWNPGYWAYGDEGYYWVPGVWVRPPQVGLLWTPGYWGWGGGAYVFHAGYWGPHVGFYGGVNYGFGYGGVGFGGGRWDGGRFAYNTAVVNVNTDGHPQHLCGQDRDQSTTRCITARASTAARAASRRVLVSERLRLRTRDILRPPRNSRIICRWRMPIAATLLR